MAQRSISTSFLILAFVLAWNSGFIGAEYALPNIAPFTLLFWRYLALAAVLGVVLSLRRQTFRYPPGVVVRTALVGVLSHGAWLCFVLLAIDQGVPAGIVALVVALQPMTTAAFSGWVTGERTRLSQWIGLAMGLIGVALVVGVRVVTDTDVAPLAYLAPFASVVAITAASLLQRRWEQQDAKANVPLTVQLFYQSAATALVVTPLAFGLERLQATWTPPAIASMVWLVLAVSWAAYALMWRLLQRLDATRVASLFYLGPPVTMLMAWLAFGDRLTLMDLAGMAIVAAGVSVVQRYAPRPPAHTS